MAYNNIYIYFNIIIYLNSITDLVLLALRLLREDIQVVVNSIEPVELWDEG